MNSILQNLYEGLVQASCSEQPFRIPSSVQRYFNNAYAFQYVTAIRRFVGDARTVLIIGDGGGRDYFSLKLLGKAPVVMDIAAQAILPEMVIADANSPLPFAPHSFDAVVIAEVLEHLCEDFRALQEVREVLRDGGALVLTVPYYHDAEPTHLRIYSPASIERLLGAAGWQVTDYVEKGGGLSRIAGWLALRMTVHAANLAAHKFIGKTFYQTVNGWIAAFDFWLGRRRHSLHRSSARYGAFIRCEKQSPMEVLAPNIVAFENMHLKLARWQIAGR